MPEITFTDAEIPANIRAPRDNPFDPVVKALAEPNAGAKQFVLPAKTEDDQRAIRSVVSQMRAAGAKYGVTVRKSISEDKGKATILVWAVPKITRTRKVDAVVDD